MQNAYKSRYRAVSAIAIALGLCAACAAEKPSPKITDAPARAEGSQAASAQPSPAPAPSSTAQEFSFDVDVSRRACARDAECQVFSACDCVRCIPSKRMDVQMCPQPSCAKEACDGHTTKCDHGLCSTQGFTKPIADWVSTNMGSLSSVGQAVFDDPKIAARLARVGQKMVIAWEPGVPTPSWSLNGAPIEIANGAPSSGHYVLVQVYIGSTANFTVWSNDVMLVTAELSRKSDAKNGWIVTKAELAP
jgi:hypothetical protein